MQLQLERPLCVLDLETTGTNRDTDRIIEIAIIKIHPDGSREEKSRRINPGRPIPPAVTELTGISDQDVADKPTFSEIAKSLYDFLKGCDILGFNSNAFDVPMLYNEFARAGIHWDHTQFRMIDAGNIFKIKEPRTLSAAVQFYLGSDHEGAHGAMADVEATFRVFLKQINHYNDLPKDMGQLELISNYDRKRLDLSGRFVYAEDGQTILLNFGSHKGEPARGHIDFIQWMMAKDFPADTQRVCESILAEECNGYGLF